MRLNPKRADARYNRGVLRLRLGKRAAGCKDLKEAVKLGQKGAKKILDQYCNS